MKLLGALAWVAFVWIVGCTGDIPSDPLPDTGTLAGFLSPINIPAAEVLLYHGDAIVARKVAGDGTFVFDDLPEGNYRLEVIALGYLVNDAARDLSVVARETTDVGRIIMLFDGEGLRLPEVEGIVFDADSGAPFVGASVEGECLAGFCTLFKAETGEDGSFRLPVPAGFETRVCVRAIGYLSSCEVVSPETVDDVVRMIVRLEPVR